MLEFFPDKATFIVCFDRDQPAQGNFLTCSESSLVNRPIVKLPKERIKFTGRFGRALPGHATLYSLKCWGRLPQQVSSS